MAHVSYHWVAGEATAQQLSSDSSSPAVLRSPAKNSILNVIPKSKYFLVQKWSTFSQSMLCWRLCLPPKQVCLTLPGFHPPWRWMIWYKSCWNAAHMVNGEVGYFSLAPSSVRYSLYLLFVQMALLLCSCTQSIEYNIPGDPAYRLVYQKGTHVVSRGFLSSDIQVLLFDCLYLCYNNVYSS